MVAAFFRAATTPELLLIFPKLRSRVDKLPDPYPEEGGHQYTHEIEILEKHTIIEARATACGHRRSRSYARGWFPDASRPVLA